MAKKSNNKNNKKTTTQKPEANATETTATETAPTEAPAQPTFPTMNKQNFIEFLTTNATYTKDGAEVATFASKAEAKRAVDAVMNGLVDVVSEGNGLAITGVLSAKPRVRPGRKNAKIFGEVKDIPATTTLRITPGKRLRDAVRGEN